MKIAIVHDYFTQRGGAERVVATWIQSFPEAKVFAAVHRPGATYPAIDEADVTTSWLQHVPTFRKDPRLATPLLPRAFASLRIPDSVDVVLVSSSAAAHSIRCQQPTVVYCHSPARWLWQEDDYRGDRPVPLAPLIALYRPFARRVDTACAHRATRYVANSSMIKRRIWSAYGIDAEVVHPPSELPHKSETPVSGLRPGYVLAIGRGRSYKNLELVASATHRAQRRLVVVGDLPVCADRRRATILRNVTDAELAWLYRNASCHVSAAHEDFGLTVVEAHSYGTPTVTIRHGGFLDTVIPGINGIFSLSESVDDLADAIDECASLDWHPDDIRATSLRFSRETHMNSLTRIMSELMSLDGSRS